MNILNRAVLDRRTVLRAGAVSLALPLLDAMRPSAYDRAARAKAEALSPRRMVLVHRPLGTYHPYFVPAKTGPDFEAPRFLKKLEPFRGQYTVFSGMGHPGYPNDHGTEPAIFTGVPELNVRDLHNTISLDQVAAKAVGAETRLPLLLLNKGASQSLSWTEKGVPVPHEGDPAAVFRKLFVAGTPEDVRREDARLEQGKSILDGLRDQLKALERDLGPADRRRVEVLAASVREAEVQLRQEELWSRKPKPKVPLTADEFNRAAANWVGAQAKWLTLVHLAIQTDSTRVVVLGMNEHQTHNVPDLELHHHDASHHGKDPAKVEQLARYEDHEFATFAEFVGKLAGGAEGDGTLLDRTQVLFTSNLGDASAHSSANLPVLLAGGGYRHRGHVSFGTGTDKPLCNLYVRMLRQLGVAADRFGSSTGAVEDLG